VNYFKPKFLGTFGVWKRPIENRDAACAEISNQELVWQTVYESDKAFEMIIHFYFMHGVRTVKCLAFINYINLQLPFSFILLRVCLLASSLDIHFPPLFLRINLREYLCMYLSQMEFSFTYTYKFYSKL